MIKKILILVVVAIIVGIAGIYGYRFFMKQTAEISPTINAVPLDAAFIIESKNIPALFEKLKKTSLIWEELQNTETFSDLNANMNYLDSIFGAEPEIKKNLMTNPVIASAHLTGRDKFDFLYLVNLSVGTGEDDVNQLLEKLSKGKNAHSQRSYNGVNITDVKPFNKGSIKPFSYTVNQGIFIFSFSSLLVEDAVRQLTTSSSLNADFAFRKVQETSGQNVDANMYFNFKTFPKLAALFLNDSYSSPVAGFLNFANWAELDVNIKEDALLLNGYTYSSDSSGNFVNIIKNQSPQNFEVDKYMPANTSTFIAYALSDFRQFEKDYTFFLDEKGTTLERSKDLSGFQEKYGIKLNEHFYSFFEKEIALVYTDVNDNKDMDQSTYILCKTKSKSTAEEKMTELITAIAAKSGKTAEDYKTVYSIDEDEKYPIYEFPIPYAIAKVFGATFQRADNRFFAIIDNYIVFGSSTKSISRYLQSIVLQKTLYSDLNYNKFLDNLVSKSNFYLYSNIAYSPGLMASYIDEKLKASIDENLNTIHKFQGFAIQLTSEDNLIYNNLYLHYNPVFKPKPHTVWESRLDAPALMKPVLLVNHYSREKEMFVQDTKNNIYLMNAAGRILWKIPLEEKIIGNVYQIDFYKNDKLQILFNTKSKIYLLDRNGNNVEKYPVILREKATNGIALFDYEKSRDYRLFIACKDRKIYAYSKEGNIIDGWEFDKTETNVFKDIQHFRVGDKDYIVFSDSLKTYILDRKGAIRVNPEKQVAFSRKNNFILSENKDNARLVNTDTSGTIHYLYFDGKVESHKIIDFSSQHTFDYQDIDGDNKRDYIFTDKNKLIVFQSSGKPYYEYKFDSPVTQGVVSYLFPGGERKLGLVDAEKGKIYLFNGDGGLYEGFPLDGNSLFSIGYLNQNATRFNLIVCSDDNFLYNYEVQE